MKKQNNEAVKEYHELDRELAEDMKKQKDSSQHLDKISKSLDGLEEKCIKAINDTSNLWQAEYDKLQVKYDLLAEQSLNTFTLPQIETALNEYVKKISGQYRYPTALISVPDFLASLGKK
jgi:hypothetical protein